MSLKAVRALRNAKASASPYGKDVVDKSATDDPDTERSQHQSVRCPANFIYRHCFTCAQDIVSLCFNHNKGHLLCSNNLHLYLWSTQSKELLHKVALPRDSTTDNLFYNAEQDTYYGVRNSHDIILFYASGMKILQEIKTIEAHTRPILCMHNSFKDDLLLTAGVESSIKVWRTEMIVTKQSGKIQSRQINLKKTDELTTPNDGSADWLTDLVYDPIHSRIFSAMGVSVQVWNLVTGYLMYVLRNVHDMPITCIAFRENTKHLITASMDKTIKIWDVKDSQLRLVETLIGHTAPVKALCIHEESSSLLSVDDHGCLKRWHLSDFEEWDSLQLPQFSDGTSEYDDIIRDRQDAPSDRGMLAGTSVGNIANLSGFQIMDGDVPVILNKGMVIAPKTNDINSNGLPLLVAFDQSVVYVEFCTSSHFLGSCSHPVISFQVLEDDVYDKSIISRASTGAPVCVLCRGSTIHMMYTEVGHDSKLLAPKAPLVEMKKGVMGAQSKGHLAEISTLVCHKASNRILIGWSSGHTSIVDLSNGNTIQFIENNENDSSAITAMEYIQRGSSGRGMKGVGAMGGQAKSVNVLGKISVALNKFRKGAQKQIIILGTAKGSIIVHQRSGSETGSTSKPDIHRAHTKRVQFLRFVTSGRQFLVSAGMEGVIKIWHIHDKGVQSRIATLTAQPQALQKTHLTLVTSLKSLSSAALTCFTLSSAKQTRRDPVEVAAGLEDGNIEFWRLHLSRLGGRKEVMTGMLSSDPVISHDIHKRSVTSICTGINPFVYASSSEDFTVIIWKILDGKELQLLAEIPFRMAPIKISFVNSRHDMLVAFDKHLCVTQPSKEEATFLSEVDIVEEEDKSPIERDPKEDELRPELSPEKSFEAVRRIHALPLLPTDKIRFLNSNSKIASELQRTRQELKKLQGRKDEQEEADAMKKKKQRRQLWGRMGRRRSIFTLPDVSMAKAARRGSFINLNQTPGHGRAHYDGSINELSLGGDLMQTTYFEYVETDIEHLKKAVIIPQGAKKLTSSFLSANMQEKSENGHWTEIRDAVSETNFNHTYPKKLMIDTKKKKGKRKVKKKKFDNDLVDRWKTLLSSRHMPSILDKR